MPRKKTITAPPPTDDELPPEIFDDPLDQAKEDSFTDVTPVSPPITALATVREQPTSLNPYRGIGTMALTPEQKQILARPADEKAISFRPDGLAYVPQVHFRETLNAAFGPGGWGLCPITPYKLQDNRVYYHGGLYVGDRFVAEAMGHAEYFPDNEGQNLSDAWESAKSDCLTRCCKDLSMFKELWDPKFLEPLQKEWQEKKREHCPKCKSPKWVRKSRQGGWFCWKNPRKGMEGCGWEGDEPQHGAAGSEAPASSTLATPSAPSPGPKGNSDTWIPPKEWHEYITSLAEATSTQKGPLLTWLADHNTKAEWVNAIGKLRSRWQQQSEAGDLPPIPLTLATYFPAKGQNPVEPKAAPAETLYDAADKAQHDRGWIPPVPWVAYIDELLNILGEPTKKAFSEWLFHPDKRNPPSWIKATLKLVAAAEKKQPGIRDKMPPEARTAGIEQLEE